MEATDAEVAARRCVFTHRKLAPPALLGLSLSGSGSSRPRSWIRIRMRDPPSSWGSSPRAPILLVLLSLAGGSRSSSSNDATSGEPPPPPPGKHKGVTFLCPLCAHSLLHRQLFLLAQAYLPHQILTHDGPIREKPLELRVWDASLQRAEADLVQVVSRLKRDAGQLDSSSKSKRNWRYHRLLKQAAGKGICPLHRVQVLWKLFCKRPDRELHPLARRRQALNRSKPDNVLHPSVRHRRTLNWPKKLFGGFGHLTAPLPIQSLPATLPLPLEKKELLGPSETQEGVRLTPTGPQTTLATEAGEAHTTGGCRCPGGETGKAQDQLGKSQRVGARVPTPRTEEAAWAASALTFLLVVLTLAVLYTRLHQKCRRGRSLYWTADGEEDHDTVAAVLKRRLLSAQVRRKKRPRQQQRRELLPSTSSDSSD